MEGEIFVLRNHQLYILMVLLEIIIKNMIRRGRIQFE